jgi:subtilisin-like proprotein convertase family protein
MVKANANIFFNVTTKAFSVGYTIINTCDTYTNSTPLPFIDQTPGNYTTATLNIPATTTITGINAFTNLDHTYLSDVQFEISSPTNPTTFVKLYNRSCGSTNGTLNLKFTDGAGGINCTAGTTLQTVAPSAALSTFSGQNPNGNWNFRVYDNFAGDTGTINSWAIELCTQTILANNSFSGLENFTIYPNPNNGNFTINFTSQSSNEVEINVHDIRGRQVFNKSYANNTVFNQNIQLNNVETGIYIVTVKDGDRKENKKIVIE